MNNHEKHRKLMQLSILVESNGDKIHIKRLREELGIHVDDEKLEEQDESLRPFIQQYIKLKSLGLIKSEIGFVLGLGSYRVEKLSRMIDYEELDNYDYHPVVLKFKKLIVKRVNN